MSCTPIFYARHPAVSEWAKNTLNSKSSLLFLSDALALAWYSLRMMRLRLSMLLISLFALQALAASPSYDEVLLGEHDAGIYAGPWRPGFHRDPYFGRIEQDDDTFLQNFFFQHLWQEAPELSRFLGAELNSATTCPNDALASLSEDIRYGYRLMVMSYLLEMIDALHRDAVLLKRAQSCSFNLQEMLKFCRPQSEDMRAFVRGLSGQAPFATPTIDQSHNYLTFEREWLKLAEDSKGGIGATRVFGQCMGEGKKCDNLNSSDGLGFLSRACEQDKNLVLQICSEQDQLFGLAGLPGLTQMLSTSNLMSLYNKEGQGLGCLRRYGQLKAGQEHVPTHLRWSLPVTRGELVKTYGERYPYGRAFVFGALKEFRKQGLADLFEPKVIEEPKKPVVVAAPKPEPAAPVVAARPVPPPVVEVAPPPKPKPPKKPEVESVAKSAFLQAAEVRRSQFLERVDVDMLKFRYDYVFNVAEMRVLADSLKDFTTREALKEMQTFDKLGTHESPVPLTFLKYLIDSENHQGLYNLTSVLGENFWVTNDVDVKFKPSHEYVELKNDESTARQWQIYLLKAN